MDLSFIILTWNSEKYIKNCISSIRLHCSLENILYEIIIVDNGSTDTTKGIINKEQEAHPGEINLIELDRNMGTTYPRNLGLKRALGNFICILDSDTEIINGSIRKILLRLEEEESLGLIAPKLILPDGTVQNSVKKFPTLFVKLKKIPKALLKMKIGDTDFYAQFPFKYETHVDSAISACWFFKKNLIDIVGYLDEKIFYAPEDLDYCMRIHKAGKKIAYYPLLEILHHTQQISHTNPLSKISISHFRGLIYYFKKYDSWFSVKINP